MNVKHLCFICLFFCDVTIGVIHGVVGADVAVTATWESGEVTNVLRLVFGDVAYTVTFAGDYLDSVLVVRVGRVGFQGCSELAEVFVDVFAMCDACNGKFEVVANTLILWPDADMVAFVLDAEIAEPLHLMGVDRLARGRLLLLSGFLLLFTGVVRLGQHVRFVGILVGVEMSQSVSHHNDGYN